MRIRRFTCAMILACLSSTSLFAQSDEDFGGVSGPVPMIRSDVTILLNSQVANSFGTEYHPGQQISLGATALCSVPATGITAGKHLKFLLTMEFLGITSGPDGAGYVLPLNITASDETEPDHIMSGNTGIIGGALQARASSGHSFYRGVVTVRDQDYDPVTGQYGGVFYAAAAEQTFLPIH